MPLTPSPVDWVSGACMIIRREVIEAIGPLDEGFYTYYDDIDFCLNAGARAGQPGVSRIAGLSTLQASQPGSRPSNDVRILVSGEAAFLSEKLWRLYTMLVDAAFLIGFATLARAAGSSRANRTQRHRTCCSTRCDTASS
jgi:N-acetylglucosaminyl-diphospho-decaprenol L-rhamnosyltransferase